MKKLAVLLICVMLLQLLSSCKSDDGKSADSATVSDESTGSAAVTDKSIESTPEGGNNSMPESVTVTAAVPREEIVSLEYQKTYTVKYTLTVDYVLDAQNLFMKPNLLP